MNTYGYIRASTTDQRHTPAVQREAIREFCAAHGLPVPAGWFEDIDISRAVSPFARPGFGELLKRLQRGDAIVVAHLDRLGEGEREMIVCANVLSDLGVSLYAASGTSGDDLSHDSTLTNLVLLMQGFGARHERRRIRDRIRRTMEHLKREHRPRNGCAPPGYVVARQKDETGRDGGAVYRVHKDEMRQVEEIMRMLRAGYTRRAIWQHALSSGWRTAAGRPWSYQRICRTIQRYEQDG